MGHYDGWAQPSGLLLNGLLFNEEASVTRVLDMERWSKVEQRTAELIDCIQPNQPSEECRNAVAHYVQQLIKKCFSCQVFTFGSVPLKTYLPDGDIDLTAFSTNQNSKDTWAQEVRDMLENEEKSENAEFHVKEVQYIQAEVKIIKCLVENIVVDISFNQLGGLCTLCFLQEVDYLINHNHLFKRSIILIKAWCYYESRILGAHHGLISTYALETLVLYIFHVFNNSFAGPLEVLYRFLEFFSNFDWDNFCVSLCGPVPISLLPQMTAEPPRRDNGELLLSKPFLDVCNLRYAVFPGGEENQGQPFVSKHFNVIDPLRTNNNLGRSVSKGNFYRIRSAFAFGAKRLARLLECPKENLINEINQFFMNTWDRHGSGHRPDAPSPDLCPPRTLNPAFDDEHENSRNHTVKRKGENVRLLAAHKSQTDGTVAFHGIPSQLNSTINHPRENMSRINNMPMVSRAQSHTICNNQNNRRSLGQVTRDSSSSETKQKMHPEKGQRSSLQDYLVIEHKEQYHFARTQSSPELTDMYGEVLSQLKQNWLHETGKNQFSSTKPDQIGRRKNMGPEVSTSQSTRSSTDDPSSLRHSSSHQSLKPTSIDSNSISNSYYDDASGLGPLESVTETIDMQQEMMHQEEQDLINMMASSRILTFNGQVQVPLNFASAHLPVSVSPGVLASMGYVQRNVAAMVPATNIHYVEPTWASNVHFTQGLVSTPIPHYFPAGLASNPEEVSESGNENSCLTELNQEDGHGFWKEHETGPSRGFDPADGSFQMLQPDNRQPLISSRVSSSGSSSTRSQHKFVKDIGGSPKEDHGDVSQYQNNVENYYSSDRNIDFRFLPATQSSYLRSKPVSESSWDGSYMRASKSTRDKQGKKTVSPAVPSAAHRKVKTGGWQHESPLSEHVSSLADNDNREWISLSATGSTEMAERSMQPSSAATPHDHQLPGYDSSHPNGSDNMIPISPMLVGSSSRPTTLDNNRAVPFAAFYPIGPPVPFLTMLPVYNFPSGTENSDGSTSHFDRDDGLESSHMNQADQNFDLAESLDQSEIFTKSIAEVVPVEPSEQHKPDILSSDFHSHLQNLLYGRFCQNNRSNGPWIYPSPVMVPPVYLQGHVPWGGPGRPLLGNVNLFTQLMSYGSPHLVPFASLQSGSNRPFNAFQHFGDEVPRYRGGTGTYLPNPKVAFRDRQSSTKHHRGNYNYDKTDHADREGNWNFSSKPRAAGRNHARIQPEKPSSRPDRLIAADSRADRPYRHEPVAAYQVQNGPFSSAHSIHSSANVSYGMYPMLPINSNGITPSGPASGPAVPSVVMLYSYDHNVGYGSQTEQLEFGSLGRFHVNEALQLGDSSQLRTVYEQRHSTYQGSSALSSPDQPSSPQFQRSAAQRINRLKDEDFPPLSFPNQAGNSGGISYSSKSSQYQTSLSDPSHS